MTIKHRENIQKFSQQKKVLTFDEKYGKLSEPAETELLQAKQLTLWHTASHQHHIVKDSLFVTEDREVEDEAKYPSEARQTEKKQVNDERHLLILAHSAEVMLESDSLDVTKRNDQDRAEGLGHATVTGVEYRLGGRTPRLSQIRRQARLQCSQLGQEKTGESTDVHLQGRRIRLTQIRHQARYKDHSQEMAPKLSCKDLRGRIVRLSEFRRHARSKTGSLVQDVIEDHLCHHLVCQTPKVGQRERIIADIFGEEDGSGAVADRHQPEAGGVLNNINGGGDHSIPDQDKMTSEKGTMRLSQLRREARFGNSGTLNRELNGKRTDEA